MTAKGIAVTHSNHHFADIGKMVKLSWRERGEKELALMDDLVPLLKKRAAGRTISGLNAYEQ